MFTIDFKPNRFEDISGQIAIKKILKAILRSPDEAPKSYIFLGEWGTGKTCLAQIFGRAINCTGKDKPCNRCDNCLNASLYQELDSSRIGNARAVRELRETWFYSIESGWRVIVIDEIQVASSAAQAAFLHILEDPPANTFFLFLTTNPEKILSPLISRCMELNFELLSDEDIALTVSKILKRVDKSITKDVMKVIIRRSGGHARDAVMLLEKAIMLGETEFINSMTLNDELYKQIFNYFLKGEGSRANEVLKELMKSPIQYLKRDLEVFVLVLFEKVMGEGRTLFNGLLNEKLLLKFLSYYIRVKPLLQDSSSNFYSAMLGLKSVLFKSSDEKPSKVVPQFSKKS